MEFVDLLRWIHVIGACVLLGTGAGIAFFMLMAHRTNNARIVAHTASVVVVADWIFTASAAALQPITGLALAHLVGWSLAEGWLILSIALYLVTGAFWMPVVWMQSQMRDLARQASDAECELPERYYRLFGAWFLCGIPAFLAVLAILWLMLVKPDLV